MQLDYFLHFQAGVIPDSILKSILCCGECNVCMFGAIANPCTVLDLLPFLSIAVFHNAVYFAETFEIQTQQLHELS